VLAALRRFFLLVLGAAALTAGVSLVFGVLAGSALDRAVSLGFYLGGCFLLLAGFFVGNRGPARVKTDSSGEWGWPFFGGGTRKLRWATLSEQMDTINSSAVFVTIGLVLVLLGLAVDTRHSIF